MENNIKINEPKLKYEYLTNPVKDSEGRIIQQAHYVDSPSSEKHEQEKNVAIAQQLYQTVVKPAIQALTADEEKKLKEKIGQNIEGFIANPTETTIKAIEEIAMETIIKTLSTFEGFEYSEKENTGTKKM